MEKLWKALFGIFMINLIITATLLNQIANDSKLSIADSTSFQSINEEENYNKYKIKIAQLQLIIDNFLTDYEIESYVDKINEGELNFLKEYLETWNKNIQEQIKKVNSPEKYLNEIEKCIRIIINGCWTKKLKLTAKEQNLEQRNLEFFKKLQKDIDYYRSDENLDLMTFIKFNEILDQIKKN